MGLSTAPTSRALNYRPHNRPSSSSLPATSIHQLPYQNRHKARSTINPHCAPVRRSAKPKAQNFRQFQKLRNRMIHALVQLDDVMIANYSPIFARINTSCAGRIRVLQNWTRCVARRASSPEKAQMPGLSARCTAFHNYH